MVLNSQEALAERNEEKNRAELLVVSDEKADSDRGRKKKISGRSDEVEQQTNQLLAPLEMYMTLNRTP